jgi:hypothetical protein
MRSIVRRNCIRTKNEERNWRVRTLRERARILHEGRKGIKDIGGRPPLYQKKKVPTKNGIRGCRLGQRSHLGRRGTLKKTYEIVSMEITKRITRSPAGLPPIKTWTLWRSRPLRNKKENK